MLPEASPGRSCTPAARQIGKREDSDSAIVYMNVEGAIDDEVLAQLRSSIPELEKLWYVTL